MSYDKLGARFQKPITTMLRLNDVDPRDDEQVRKFLEEARLGGVAAYKGIGWQTAYDLFLDYGVLTDGQRQLERAIAIVKNHGYTVSKEGA